MYSPYADKQGLRNRQVIMVISSLVPFAVGVHVVNCGEMRVCMQHDQWWLLCSRFKSGQVSGLFEVARGTIALSEVHGHRWSHTVFSTISCIFWWDKEFFFVQILFSLEFALFCWHFLSCASCKLSCLLKITFVIDFLFHFPILCICIGFMI